MNDPPSTPQRSPREQKCPDAPRKKNKNNAKEENNEKCVCDKNLYCNECLDDFEDKDKTSRSLF